MASRTKATITNSKKESPNKPYPVWYGGMMRCCIATAEKTKPGSLKIGSIIPCLVCGSRLVLEKDGIHWDGNS